MDFSAFLEQTEPADVVVAVRKDGETLGTLTLRPCDRAALDTLRKQSTKSVINPKTRAAEERVDEDRLRTGLITRCVVGWSGWTYGSAALAMGRKLRAGSTEVKADAPLPYQADTALRVLGAMIGIEDVIWAAALQRVESEAAAEADEKNE